MSILSSILQHAHAGQALKPAAALPQAASTSGSSSSAANSSAASADSATISANDFLTLLVTEMQNQDPTSDTDPNEYINQLVSVNSLEQLININQTLTSDSTGAASSGTSTDALAKPSVATSGASALAAKTAQPTAGSSLSSLASSVTPKAAAAKTSATPHAAGNFTIPNASPSALRVANALNGRSHGPSGHANSLQPAATPEYSGR